MFLKISEKMDDIEHVVKNSIWVTLGRITALILTLISTLLLARLLNPHEYGLLNLSLTIMFLGNAIADFGINAALIYFIPRTENKESVIKRLLKYKIITTAVTSLIIFLLSNKISILYNTPELKNIIKFFAISHIFYSFFFFAQSALQGLRAFKLFMFTDIILSFSRYIPILTLILKMGLNWAVIGFCVAYFLSGTISFLIIFPYLKSQNNKKVEFKNKEIYSYAFFNFGAGLFYLIYNMFTNLLIGYYLPISEVGFFTLAWQISYYGIMTFPAVISISLLPNLSEMVSKKEEIHNLFRRATKYMIYLVLPTSIGLIMLGARLITLIFGIKYSPVEGILILMSLGFMIQGCATSIDNLVLGIGKPKFIMFRNGIQALINLILCIILLPKIGLPGAGISFIVTNIIGTMLINYWAVKSHRFWYPFKSLFRAIIASIIMAIFIKQFFWLRQIYLVIYAIPIYFIVLFIMWGFDKEDIKTLGLEKLTALFKKN